MLQPLAALKSYLTVISGLENKLVVSGSSTRPGRPGAPPARLSVGTPYERHRSISWWPTSSQPGPRSALSRWGSPRDARRQPGLAAYRLSQGAQRAQQPRIRSQGVVHPIVHGHQRRPDMAATDQATKLASVRKSVLDAVSARRHGPAEGLGAADKQRLERTSSRSAPSSAAFMTMPAGGGTSTGGRVHQPGGPHRRPKTPSQRSAPAVAHGDEPALDARARL